MPIFEFAGEYFEKELEGQSRQQQNISMAKQLLHRAECQANVNVFIVVSYAVLLNYIC